jgi:recombination protein RecA
MGTLAQNDTVSVPLDSLDDLARLAPLVDAGVRRGVPVRSVPAEWKLATFAGRLGEISGGCASAALTLVFRLVLEAQRAGQPVVWIAGQSSTFFPPDAADAGVDLAALPVIRVPQRVPDVRSVARAADHLIRSGAFGLVVLDLGRNPWLPIPVQTRLSGLASKHDTALFCLTEKDTERSSLGSLVSLRAEASRTERSVDGFRCEARILKDKRRRPDWNHAETCRGPDGLC